MRFSRIFGKFILQVSCGRGAATIMKLVPSQSLSLPWWPLVAGWFESDKTCKVSQGWELRNLLYSAFPPKNVRRWQRGHGSRNCLNIFSRSLRQEFYQVISLLGTLPFCWPRETWQINPRQRLGLVGVSWALSLTGKFERKLWKKNPVPES